jgi:hypothetical protein
VEPSSYEEFIILISFIARALPSKRGGKSKAGKSKTIKKRAAPKHKGVVAPHGHHDAAVAHKAPVHTKAKKAAKKGGKKKAGSSKAKKSGTKRSAKK